MLKDDWEIVPNPMTFMQAIENMKSGSRVKRISRSYVIFCDRDGNIRNKNRNIYDLDIDDIEATDWIILEEEAD